MAKKDYDIQKLRELLPGLSERTYANLYEQTNTGSIASMSGNTNTLDIGLDPLFIKNWAERGPEAGNRQLPTSRLTVDLPQKTATLDGSKYDIRSERALRWLKVRSDHHDVWISSAKLKEYDDELVGARSDRLRVYLPPEIARLVDSQTGAGSRIRL